MEMLAFVALWYVAGKKEAETGGQLVVQFLLVLLGFFGTLSFAFTYLKGIYV